MATDIKKRNQPGNQTQDTAAIANLEYNQAAGAQKVTEVGRHFFLFLSLVLAQVILPMFLVQLMLFRVQVKI